MSERKGVITFKGGPLTLVGDEGFKVGQPAPDVTLSKTLLEDMKLSDLKGKKVVLNVVPSLDTPVCSVQTARFNKEAGTLGEDVVVLTVSADLPVAQSRWCQANSATHVRTASDYKHHDFAKKSGLLIRELGLFARAVIVIDAAGQVRYAEVVSEVASEPNYDNALTALRALS